LRIWDAGRGMRLNFSRRGWEKLLRSID